MGFCPKNTGELDNGHVERVPKGMTGFQSYKGIILLLFGGEIEEQKFNEF